MLSLVCMQVLDLPSKVDKITDFAWEPKGTRFAVLHGEGNRPTLSLYDMEGGGKVCSTLAQLQS